MNVAIIIDCICNDTDKLIRTIAAKHNICVFLPVTTQPLKTEYQIRFFEKNFDCAGFQRYDVVVFMAVKNWPILIHFIKQIKCVAVVTKDNEYYQEISTYTEYIISEILEINKFLDSMPEHIMWLARGEQEIFERIKSLGLFTDKFRESYYKIYSIKAERRKDMEVKKINKCRVCGNKNLKEVLNLGEQELTGVFPKNKEEVITSGPLDLHFCPRCGLLQLGHSYNLDEMYGDNYGYRSGLNPSMVDHLSNKINMLESRYGLKEGDVVLDIGSNDGTSLNAYKTLRIRRIGMDPTGKKFGKYYNDGIELVTEFFSSELFKKICDNKAKIVTSISMFYDLECPIDFAKQVESILADDGIWHLEQSYMPMMLRNNSYDTICHEHLEYYSLGVIKYIMDAANLKLIDVTTNDINGGSFAITVAKANSTLKSNTSLINWYLKQEKKLGLDTEKPYVEFAERTVEHRRMFKELLDSLIADGKLVCGYGASTKGNVLLQYCSITEKQIKIIGEVNPDKFGTFTPATYIPIDDEAKVKEMNPDYLVVMPWHFRNGILAKEKAFLKLGGHFIFPLPFIEIV